MNLEQLFERYRELQQYVGWSDEDARRVNGLAGRLKSEIAPLSEDFYAEIQRHPQALKVITGGEPQIERLKGSLRAWLHQLLHGPYDQQYVERRWRVGIRHAEIGLEQYYTNAALARLRGGLNRAIRRLDALDSPLKTAAIESIDRLLDLDLAIIDDSYEFHRMQIAKEHERRRGEMKFRNLVEAAACMIVILRPSMKIAYFSPFAERLTGFGASAVIGHDYPDLFVETGSRRGFRTQLNGILSGESLQNYEMPVRCRDGSKRWLTWNALRIDDFDGQQAVLAVGHDITDIRSAAQRLVQTERLAAIGQTITGLAHESRNALQRIISCTEMLEFEVEDNESAMQLIRRLNQAQDDLRRLFDEVRSFAAPIQLEKGPCGLPRVWREAWELLRTEFAGRDVELSEALAAELPDITADRFRLVQVFRNLFENSLAACRDPVRLRVEAHPARNDHEWIEIHVRDNGPGLEGMTRMQVFQPFFTTKTKGTGLGMAIAQRILEAHGGMIQVGDGESHVDDEFRGAEFILRLPLG